VFGIWDPRSRIQNPRYRIRDQEKTYSGFRIQGVKKALDPGSGSATLDFLKYKSSVLVTVELGAYKDTQN
jgi:hypothetical protein